MKRYLSIFHRLFNYNVIREMEFRGHFIAGLITDVMWITLQVLTINIFFSFTDNITGWSKMDTLALIGFFRTVKGFFDAFFRNSLFRFPESISRGEMDYLLTRPIDALFISSTRYQHVSALSDCFYGIVILSISLSQIEFSPISLLAMILSIPFSVLIFYCLIGFLSTLSIFLVRITYIRPFYDMISQVARFPSDVFSFNRLWGVLLPIALIATVPIKILTLKSPLWYVLGEAAISLLLFTLLYKFWRFSLRSYSSASS